MPENETDKGTSYLDSLTFEDVDRLTDDPVQVPDTELAPQEPEPEMYLRTSTGTVYKTSEDAVRGTEEKDRLIEQLRQTAIASTGYDPIDKKPVQIAQPSQEPNYATDAARYYTDLSAASSKGDAKAFHQIQSKMFHDTLGPYLPAVADSAKNNVLENVASEYGDFKEHIRSDGYKEYLEERSIIKTAIETAEADPRRASELKDLYILAYEASKGHKLPELIKSAKTNSPASTTQGRTLLATTTAPQVSTSNQLPDISTPEGRAEIKRRFEQGGGLDVPLAF